MAWGYTKRHQEALCSGQYRPASEGPDAGQGRWFFHLPPWRRWVSGAACVAGLLCGAGVKAQISAPFVFSGQVLHIDSSEWEPHSQYLVAAPAYFDVKQGVQGHIAGNIDAQTGSRNGLYKLGGGTLRLSGQTSYLGSTQLLQGGLHLDGPRVFSGNSSIGAIVGTSLEYSPGITVGRPVTLSEQRIDEVLLSPGLYGPVTPLPGMEDVVGWRVQAGRAEHSGLLQGSAPFVKQGSGLLDITGDAMAYTGQARVAEGALAINEIFSGSVVVQSGARLQGAGYLAAAHIESGGTLAPGNSIGALTVTRDLRFDPGSRFEVEATPAGESDYVWVSGKALLDGEVAVLAQHGQWQASTSYPILNAQGGFDDSRFAAVSSDLVFLTPSLAYDADTVTLTLMRNDTPIDEVAETPDEEEVGKVIDEPAPPDDVVDTGAKPTPDSGPDKQEGGIPAPPKANPGLHDDMVGLDRDDARVALRQLTGSWNASVLSSVWDDSRFLREAVLRRTAMAGPSAGPWVEVFHSNQARDGADGVLGDKRRLDGLVLGVAAAVHELWTVGGYFGVQRSQLERDQGVAQADIDSTHLGLHIAGQIDSLRLAMGAARTLHRLATSRAVRAGTLNDLLRARYRGHTSQIFGEAAWPAWHGRFGWQNRFVLSPFGRLAWVHTRFDAYSETGGPAALNARRAALTGWVSTLGLRAEAAVDGPGGGGALVYAQLGWDHANRARAESTQSFRASATQTLFTSQGLPPTRNAWAVQLGMDARVGKAADVGFGYLGRFGSGVSDQGVGGWARIAF